MLVGIESQRLFGRFKIDPIEIGVVGLADFCAVKFRAADKEMDQAVNAGEAGKTYQIERRSGLRHDR
jgi:hypothetical protein